MARSLREWWMDLFRARGRPTAPDPVRNEPGGAPRTASGPDEHDGSAGAPPTRRRYIAPAAADDPQREAHLGAVLQALAGGPLSRAELGRQVGAAEWGPGRLESVVDHGIATGVLVAGDDGTVRARYAD
jgi:hypothetical protein